MAAASVVILNYKLKLGENFLQLLKGTAEILYLLIKPGSVQLFY
jgi:hypothetical protein